MGRFPRRSFLGVLTGAALLTAVGGGRAQPVSFTKSKLSIETAKGRHSFDIELANTDAQHTRGLMYRRKLAADAGMLFDYKYPQPITMWMKNTLIQLDMVFIDGDGRIINIAQRTVPYSEAVIPSRGAARAVLEINGGTAERLGIMPGDKVIHPLFGTGR